MKSQIGQISRHQPYANQVRFLAVPLLMVLCLGVFLPSTASACHNGKPHGPHTCGGGDPGGGSVPGVPTMAQFMGPYILDEDVPRDCPPPGTPEANLPELTVDSGRIICSTTESLRISTAGMTLNSRKRDLNFCRALENLTTVTPISPAAYQYGWTDNCTDGDCQVFVDLSFNGQRVLDATGGKSDAVDIRVTGTLSGASIPGNPFSNAQELAMSQMNMQFRKPGDTAIAAVCDWFPQSVDIGGPFQHFVFTSEPVQP
jgi:hypothetical protein